MTLTFTDARIQNDNGVWLCLKVREPYEARRFISNKKDLLYGITIRQHRERDGATMPTDICGRSWTSWPMFFILRKRNYISRKLGNAEYLRISI